MQSIWAPLQVLTVFSLFSIALAAESSRGRWSAVLDFPESYENAVDAEGKPYFSCKGHKLEPFDPLRNWWIQRCYDDASSKPKRPRICNSTAICCYKTCVLQRLEWLDKDFGLDKKKAHKLIHHQYNKLKYPPEIIEDIIDEYDMCALWYDQHDREGCSNNGPFAKCQSMVLLSVCDPNILAQVMPKALPPQSMMRSVTSQSMTTLNPTETTESTSTKPIVMAGRSIGNGLIPLQAVPYQNSSCFSKCKSLCLGKTKF